MSYWHNGRLRGEGAAALSPFDRGFTLGDGVYETIRVENGAPCWLDRHIKRLRCGAALLRIPLNLNDTDIRLAVAETLAANQIGDGALRITLSRGLSKRGLAIPDPCHPSLVITAHDGAAPMEPVRVIISQQTRRNEFSPLCGIKSINTLDSMLARMEATDSGADDALLLNTKNHVAEACAANLVVYRSGVFITPLLSDGALPGVARQLIIEKTGAVQRSLSKDDLRASEALFLTSSLGVKPIAVLNDRPTPGRPDLLEVLQRCLLAPSITPLMRSITT